MKRKNKILISAVFLLIIAGIATAFAATAGSQDDPLVTKTYVDNIKAELTQMINSISSNTTGSTGGTAESGFTAVQLNAGQTVTASSGGIEVLTRRGDFVAVDPAGDGIVNLTSGTEHHNNEMLTLQNLYMIPRADGRGVKAQSDGAWVMVRGKYTVK
ncbi:MAG: hypothetical protein Q8865_01960 [Bacillota bacterium]|nr:hypothetical protein [Bacillota bacterium]